MTTIVTTDGHTITLWEAGAPILELAPAAALRLAQQLTSAVTPQQAINLLG